MSHETLSYRQDIDGIRAIAVGVVVLYHAFPKLLTGGFVGVDIFFVISGFLITGILVREQQRAGRIDLATFYARRVRRLLPALLGMLLTTLALGLWLLPATGELQSLASSTLAALFFASNLYFALQPAGYFAAAPESFPLLHTWTLAVEEQFYIVWPLLIPLAVRLGTMLRQPPRRALWLLFGAVFAVSLALCVIMTGWRANYAFYLTPFRAWEFAIGALLSLAVKGDRPRHRAVGAPLALLGLGAIAAAAWGFDHRTAFPGWNALLPTLGAAALLTAGALQPGNPIARALALPPFVYIGRLSYGWYLWHWPLLTMLRTDGLGQASDTGVIVAVLAAFAVSAISYHLVETPIRNRSWRPFRTTRVSLMSGIALLASGAAAAAATTAYADRTLRASPPLQRIAAVFRTIGQRPDTPASCENHTSVFTGLTPARACMLGRRDARRIVVLMGDSHARHLRAMLDRWAERRGLALLPRAAGGCNVFGEEVSFTLAVMDAVSLRKCRTVNAAILDEIAALAQSGRLVGVVLAARWPEGGEPFARPGADPIASLDPTTYLARLITLARERNVHLVLTRDTPSFAHRVPYCLSRRAAQDCTVTVRQADTLRIASNRAIDALAAAHRSIRAFDPSRALCDARFCYPELDGTILFEDRHHLSIHGSWFLEPRLRPALDHALLAP